jgi:colicin import membrane protein
VPQYVIVDNQSRRGARRLRLLDYRLADGVYRLHPPDAAERVHLVIADLWLGIEGDHVVCYDEHGAAFGDYATVVRRAKEAERRAKEAERWARREAAAREAEARLRAAAEEQARQEAAAREAEARLRHAAEARLRALEEELRRLRGEG